MCDDTEAMNDRERSEFIISCMRTHATPAVDLSRSDDNSLFGSLNLYLGIILFEIQL